jgi:hypothetical protein
MRNGNNLVFRVEQTQNLIKKKRREKYFNISDASKIRRETQNGRIW